MLLKLQRTKMPSLCGGVYAGKRQGKDRFKLLVFYAFLFSNHDDSHTNHGDKAAGDHCASDFLPEEDDGHCYAEDGQEKC